MNGIDVHDHRFDAASTDAELRQILDLQARNLEAALAADEVREQGSVTLRHDLELLREMNAAGAHAIAVVAGRVVGYALFLARSLQPRFPALAPMLAELRRVELNGRPLEAHRYFIMGQVCVDREHRGSGVFAGLYAKLRELHEPRFELCVTEVARRNQRSIRAHEKVGFELLSRYGHAGGAEWDLIGWSWRRAAR